MGCCDGLCPSQALFGVRCAPDRCANREAGETLNMELGALHEHCVSHPSPHLCHCVLALLNSRSPRGKGQIWMPAGLALPLPRQPDTACAFACIFSTFSSYIPGTIEFLVSRLYHHSYAAHGSPRLRIVISSQRLDQLSGKSPSRFMESTQHKWSKEQHKGRKQICLGPGWEELKWTMMSRDLY